MSDEQNDLNFDAKAMTVVKDEDKAVVEILPVNVVESFIDEAEKRISCINKMKRVIFKVTNISDWVDQGGKPYLQGTGAESIATALHIEWDRPEREIEAHEDGHKTYKFGAYFYFLGRRMWVIGSRSSRDPFFAKAGDTMRPVDTINMANVEKAAYTNLLNNGIKRITGIRNMTWDLLEEAYGLKREAAASVDYSAKTISKPQQKRLFAIGKTAGWSDDDVAKYLAEDYAYSSSADILKKDYDPIWKHIEANPKN